MKIQEFIDRYCQDIVEKAKTFNEVVGDLDFTYDAIIEGEDGSPIKVIYAEDNTEIPIFNILSLSDLDFRKTYPSRSAYEAYKNYLSAFIILEGEDVLNEIRNNILKSKERIDMYSSIDINNFLSPFN